MKIKNLTFEGYIGSICLFLFASLATLIFSDADFVLNNFSDLYLGQATLDGIDATKRVSIFYNIILLSVLVLPFLYVGIFKLKSKTFLRPIELKTLSIISTTGFFLILSNIMGIESNTVVLFFQSLFLINICFIVIRNIFKTRFPYFHIQPLTLTLTFIIVQLFLVLFNSAPITPEQIVFRFFIIFLLLNLLVYLGNQRLKFSFQRIFSFFLFIAVIPISTFVSIELLFWYKLQQNILISHQTVSLIFISLALVINILLVLKNKIEYRPSTILRRYYIPSTLLSFILLTAYIPIQRQSNELFELANSSNAIMKIFKFNEIPFVDFFNSHMSFDFLFGSLYVLIFGYQADLDFLSYNFMYTALIFLVVYMFNQKLFSSSIVALLFTISFPLFGNLYYHSMVFSLVALFVILQLVKDQNSKNYILLFITLISLIIWRLDTGIATLFTSIIFVPLIFFANDKTISLSILIKSLSRILLLLLILVLVALIIKSPELLLNNFKSALHYVKANQAHAYTLVTREFNHQFYLFYFFIPMVAISSVFYGIYFFKKNIDQLSAFQKYSLSSSLFLFIIFLVNFQRGLIRHGFMENSEGFLVSTFYLAITLFCISFIPSKNVAQRYFVFFGLSFLIIIITKYFPVHTGKTTLEKLFAENNLDDFDKSVKRLNKSTRIIENQEFASNNYIDLKYFLDQYTNSNQTFLDFSNTPMLYYYCQRNVPGYFCQNLQNTVDDYLQVEHLKMITPSTVPITIYSHYPTNAFDHMDGVPGALRHYLIAEYIYSHYRPYQIINNRSIWAIPQLQLPKHHNEQDTLILKPQTHHYKLAASAIENHFNLSKNASHLLLLKTLHTVNSNEPVSLDSNICVQDHLFLRIALKQPIHQQQIRIEILNGENLIGVNTFNTSFHEDAYMVRLSNHYLWHTEKATAIKISAGHNTIDTIDFYKDLRLEDTK